MTLQPSPTSGSPARLVVADHEVVLATSDGHHLALEAVEIFRVAVRGEELIRGYAVDNDVARSCPGVLFRQQPADVVLVLRDRSGRVDPVAGIDHRGSLREFSAARDHTLIDSEWYPLDPASSSAVRAWVDAWSDAASDERGRLYLELYRSGDKAFRIADELPDRLAASVAAYEGPLHRLQLTPYPYQAQGIEWLVGRLEAVGGAILADQMGLGKTLQLIGLIAHRRTSASSPVLVVMPLTLVENWAREIARAAPQLSIYRHVGPSRVRRPTELAKVDVVLTTYDLAVLDEPVLSMVDWSMVVLDEAQAIKNADTQRRRALTQIRRSAAVVATGTPLENRTSDLWSLTDFALPGFLGDWYQFVDSYHDDPERLRHAVRAIMLRREVEQVADDLPDKIEIDVPLEMFGPERAAYDEIREGIRGSRTQPVLSLITKLRVATALAESTALIDADTFHAKIARLRELLEEIRDNGEKVLVFSAFTRSIDGIVLLAQRKLGLATWAIDGRTPASDRQRAVDEFSASPDSAVLVLNPTAGGVGLNIQAATRVIHHTLEWNPAREAQATARAWRRGQELPVTVHRLYYVDTIDEYMVKVLSDKQELFDRVISPSTSEDRALRTLLDMALRTNSGERDGGHHGN